MSGEDSWRSIPALTAAAAERFGEALAISDGTTTMTYSGLFDSVRHFAGALVTAGVNRGDRVAIWAFNSAEWIVACLGLLQAGAVLVPINTRFKGLEAADVLSRSRARALVTVTDFLGTDYVSMLRSTGQELPELKTIVVAHGGVPEGTESWARFLDGATAWAVAEADRRGAHSKSDDISDILFTSGTTGIPKGVVMTHGRTLYCGTDWVTMTCLGPTDRYLMINPYFSQFGYKGGILACLAAGAAMLPEAVFDVGRALKRVQNESVTVLPGPPTLYQSILDHPQRDRYDLSSLRVAVTGSSDIPIELIRRIDQELPFSTIISGYGMTEGGTASSTEPGDNFEAIATTVGRARPQYEVRIVDEQGSDLPAGEIGEIVFRGPGVMAHYLDNEEATAATLSADGWLRSMDLGMFDDSGRLHIAGRIKDMYIVGGFNAYPPEIENQLLRHPDISQAAVIGIPDKRLGEVGMAFVILTPEATSTTGEDIISWCREQMANYKVPRAVEIVHEFPLTGSGKVHKEVLRARALSDVSASS